MKTMNLVGLASGLVGAVSVGCLIGGPVGFIVGCLIWTGAFAGFILNDIANGMADLDETK
jgi:hypothetical protein